MNAEVQRTSVIFIYEPLSTDSTLVCEQLPAYSSRRGCNVPAPQVGQINLIEVGTAECHIRRPRNHDALRIPGKERHLATRRHLVHIVGSVAGHQQISLGVK